jgi:Leucine-rich repeat (LRR) protein
MYNYVTREQQNTFGYHLQPKFRKIGSKNCDLLDLFEEGIAKEKLHKIELRKDAMMLLRIKQKYDIISQHFAKYKDNTYAGHKKPKFPVIKLNNGDNLLMYPPDEMYQFYEVYEIFLEELQNCNISFFGALPNLHKLSIRFSNISLMDEKEYLSMPRYVNLRELNLNCNNLDSSCLDIISHMKNLRILNLMGNFINAEIPDLTELEYLEEINLSYNHIESYFVNLNLLKDFKLHGNNIIQENENENEDINKINQTEESKDEDVVNTQSNIRNSKPNKKKGKDFSNEESKTNNSIESINNKKGNNISKNNISYNDREINAKHLSNNQQIFFNLQKYLETNIQPFFHKLSLLKNLKTLNLSHNKIHFFDINQEFLQKNNGFKNLDTLDLSNNIIEDEIAILMIINLPVIKNVDVSENPLVNNKAAFEDIEYEIFKFKNILLTNRVKPRKTNKIILKDLLAFPPAPYLVKKFPFKPKSKKELIVPIKEEPIIVPDKEEDTENNNYETDNEIKNNNSEKIGDVELPPIFNNVNPIFDTKLDIVGKSKKNKIYNKKK